MDADEAIGVGLATVAFGVAGYQGDAEIVVVLVAAAMVMGTSAVSIGVAVLRTCPVALRVVDGVALEVMQRMAEQR